MTLRIEIKLNFLSPSASPYKSFKCKNFKKYEWLVSLYVLNVLSASQIRR